MHANAQMEPMTIAIDLAKRFFHIHYVEPETGAIYRKLLKRARVRRAANCSSRCEFVR